MSFGKKRADLRGARPGILAARRVGGAEGLARDIEERLRRQGAAKCAQRVGAGALELLVHR